MLTIFFPPELSITQGDRAASIWNIANQHGRGKRARRRMHWFLKLPHENNASLFCLYFIGQSESHEIEKDMLLEESEVWSFSRVGH